MRKAGYLSVGSRKNYPKSWLLSWESRSVPDPSMIQDDTGGIGRVMD